MEKEKQSKAHSKSWKNLQQSFYDTLRKNPKLQYILYGLIIIIVAFLYFGWPEKEKLPSNTQGIEQVDAEVSQNEEESLEARLTKTLEKIQDVGKVEVLINYESTSEVVPAMSIEKQSSGGQNEREASEPFTMQGDEGEGPLVIMEIEPQIRGVIIVAEGASDPAVRMKLQSAAQTALGVPASKVEVFSMSTE